MSFEVEQKYPLKHPAEVEAALQKLGATFRPAIEQVDEYFAHPVKDFAKTDEALRLRRVGESNFLTYKGPKLDSTTKTRHEIEVSVASGTLAYQDLRNLLIALGFNPVSQVRKVRRPIELRWEGQHVEVAIDEVANVGGFVELELIVEQGDLEPAKRSLDALAKHLQLAQPERRSYLELLLERLAQDQGTAK